MNEDDKIDTSINFGSEAFKKYFANTSWMFAEKIIRLLVGFVVGIYVVRYLGPEDFGLFSYALSFVGLFATISTLGLDSIVVRELVKKPERRDEILGSVFNLRIWGAVLSIALLAATVFITREASFTIVLILIISATNIFQCLNVVEYYFQAKVESKFNVYVQSTAMLAAGVLKVILILTQSPLIFFAIVHVSESVVLSIGYVIVYKKNNLSITKWYFRKDTAKILLKDAWPLILSGIVISVYARIDQIMIKNMLETKEVGLYAAAVKLAESWYLVPIVISSSLFPAILKAKEINEQLYFSRLQKLYDLLAYLAIGFSIVMSIFSGFIIELLFGKDFVQSAPVLTIYVWAGVSVSLGIATSQFLVSENLTKISFYRTFLGMILNVVLNLLLIPTMGIKGSAIATLISYTAATFSIGLTKKTFSQFKLMLNSILFVSLFRIIRQRWRSN